MLSIWLILLSPRHLRESAEEFAFAQLEIFRLDQQAGYVVMLRSRADE
jgi:hypothetical protein